jgi:hypothetical protein
VGYLSRLEELTDRPGLARGNKKLDSDRLSNNQFSHANLYDIADTLELKNQEQARLGVVEMVDLESSMLNERDHRHTCETDRLVYEASRKTLAGALQLPVMPWEYEASARKHFGLGLAGLLGLGLTLL